MSAKIRTAVDIVRETGVEVFIVQAGTIHAYRALNGNITGDSLNQLKERENWIGTRISLLKDL